MKRLFSSLLLSTSLFATTAPLDQALACLHEQEQEKAFVCFLSALETKKPQHNPCAEEKAFYEEALKLYLEKGSSPEVMASELIKKYEQKGVENPSWLYLNALVATAYGNLGQYEKFFKLFHANYCPENFLTAKTKGIITLRLGTVAKTEEERAQKKEQALQYLEEALQKNEKDPSLYRLVILLAEEKNDVKLKMKYLEKMAQSEAIILRQDICFYVNECVAAKRCDLGEKILAHAKKSYQYSRAIESAEELLKNAR